MKLSTAFTLLTSALVGLYAIPSIAKDVKITPPSVIDRPAPIKPIRPIPLKPVSFDEIKCKSSYSAPLVEYENKYEIITDSHRFVDLYLETDSNSQEPVPTIDFDTTTVIALLPQPRPNPSYGIRVDQITESIRHVNVNVEYFNYTSSDWAVIQVIHYPYCFYSMPKTNKRITFTSTEQSYRL